MPLPLVYNRVHAMVGEKAFDSWMETLETKENAAYEKVPSDHGWTNVTYVRYVRVSVSPQLSPESMIDHKK